MKEQILEIIKKHGQNFLVAKAEVEKLFPLKPSAKIEIEKPKPAKKAVKKK